MGTATVYNSVRVKHSAVRSTEKGTQETLNLDSPSVGNHVHRGAKRVQIAMVKAAEGGHWIVSLKVQRDTPKMLEVGESRRTIWQCARLRLLHLLVPLLPQWVHRCEER